MTPPEPTMQLKSPRITRIDANERLPAPPSKPDFEPLKLDGLAGEKTSSLPASIRVMRVIRGPWDCIVTAECAPANRRYAAPPGAGQRFGLAFHTPRCSPAAVARPRSVRPHQAHAHQP